MKKSFKIIICIVLGLAVCGYGAMQMLAPLALKGETAAYDDLTDTFTVQGKVTPLRSVILNATASGTVASLPFKPGMAVEEGCKMVEIAASSPAELEIQKQQLRQQLATAEYQYQQLFSAEGKNRLAAALEAAKSAYALAERQYQAALDVEAEISGVYTPAQLSELENAVMGAKQALAAVEAQDATTADRNYYSTLIASTQAQLEALEEEAQNEPLLAPFSGVVWQLMTDEGSYIIKNQPVLRLYQSGPMKVEVSLLSDDTLRLHLDETALLNLSDGSNFTARVSFISPVAEQTISSLGLTENRCTVELQAAGLPEGLGAGHQLDVIFTRTIAENVLSVPASALVPLSGGSAIYTAKGGKAVLNPVQTGLRCGGRVEITAGLDTGDIFIINPYEAGVKDGSRVTVENND